MPAKTTKKSGEKNDVKTSKTTKVKTTAKSKTTAVAKTSTKAVKETTTKKAVVKRRKLDLAPTRASAVAIVSQANRAKKKALIEKLASEEMVVHHEKTKSSMIPLWVRIFFGCSLMLFCISFYQAIIRPQLEAELTEASREEVYVMGGEENIEINEGGNNTVSLENYSGIDNQRQDDAISVPKTATETIEEFFRRLSNHQFDEAFDLFSPTMQRSSEIREHFTSFRMNPFVNGIDGGLTPTNFKYVSTSTYGRDRYSFNLSYVVSSTQERYDETREFVVDTSGDEPNISTIVCTTSKCSYHPIFWPENFGMMR